MVIAEPKNQNQEMPSMERKTLRIDRPCRRYLAAGQVPDHGNADEACCQDDLVIRVGRDRNSADDQAENDCHVCAGFHKCVTAYQFIPRELLREVGVLHGTEQCRLTAHQEKHDQEQGVSPRYEGKRSHHHQRNLEYFYAPHQAGFFVLVGELSRGGGEQKKWQDEQ
jgi:hypothetical protein